ncbi:MAG: hypothetical protein GC160_22355 [Acidobacteria bacterium]|nr:hypothetical protein [Acidobacteriota bacterium]
MRLPGLIVVFVATAAAAGQQSNQEAPAPPPPPRVQRSGGVTVIRGSTTQVPRPPAEKAEATAGEASGSDAKPAPAPKPPRNVQSSGTSLDSNGRQRQGLMADSVSRTDGTTAHTRTLQSINGRTVPYITEKETKLPTTGGGPAVSEKRIQRYDPNGRPSQQELVRTEERKLPGGAVERVETVYREDLNGKMQAVEKTISTTSEKGSVKTTTKQTEKPSINGRFEPFLREESTERKISDTQATVETVRKAGLGGGLEVVAREESTMTKDGDVATTETKRYERQPMSGDMALASRSVGRLEERSDGSVVEKVETYGYKTAGGAINLNATRPTLQEVTERRQTTDADGTVHEKITTRGLDNANTTQLGPPTIKEAVTKPTADGAEVRTEVYEQSVNGRMRPTQVSVQKIEK